MFEFLLFLFYVSLARSEGACFTRNLPYHTILPLPMSRAQFHVRGRRCIVRYVLYTKGNLGNFSLRKHLSTAY